MNDNLKASIILIVMVILASVGIYVAFKNQEPIRDANLCATENEYGETIVVVDKSDLWLPHQSNRLKEAILWTVNEHMGFEERLTIYTFSDYQDGGHEPIFSFCKPNNKANNITKSKYRVEKRYKQKFGDPLNKTLSILEHPDHGKCSPIAEIFADILTRREHGHRKGPIHLILISDMIQNSKRHSLFKRNSCYNSNYTSIGVETLLTDSRKKIENRELKITIYQIYGKYPETLLINAKRQWGKWFKNSHIEFTWEKL